MLIVLTPRRIEIFKAIVDEYIKTGEPVSSKALQQRHKMSYSSATIRNDMQALEEMGYLEKTHTSSGRIPSTAGYKFYCENLLDEAQIDKKMEVAIKSAFDVSNFNLDEAVQQSCRIISEMTNMTTGAIGPDASKQRLEHIKLFQIDSRKCVAVFITSTGHTETKNFYFEDDIPFSDMENCTDILNSRLRGVPIDQLAERMENIRPELNSVVQKHDILFTAFVKAFVKFASDNVYFSGKDRILYQPEFEDINKLKKLMNMLEDTSSARWKQLDANENAVAVTTQQGAQLTWVNDVAVVRSTFRVNDDESGQLMVVGPSRMDYDKVITMIEYVSHLIEKMYNEGGGNRDG